MAKPNFDLIGDKHHFIEVEGDEPEVLPKRNHTPHRTGYNLKNPISWPLVNIPKSRQDGFYRYQRHFLKTSVKNNKTIIENLNIISSEINRDHSDVSKYLSINLNTSFSIHLKTVILNGTFETLYLDDILEKFITEYVICEKCGNPETVFGYPRQSTVGITCNSCGHQKVYRDKSLSKFSKYLLKKLGKEKIVEKSNLPTFKDHDPWLEEWSVPTDSESVKKREKLLFDTNMSFQSEESSSSPIDELSICPKLETITDFIEYFSRDPAISEYIYISLMLMENCLAEGKARWTKTKLLKMTFAGLFLDLKNFKKGFIKKIEYLRHLIENRSDQTLLIECILHLYRNKKEEMVNEDIRLIDLVGCFYEEGFLSSQVILEQLANHSDLTELIQYIKKNEM